MAGMKNPNDHAEPTQSRRQFFIIFFNKLQRFYNYNGLINRFITMSLMAMEDLKIVHTVFLEQGHTCSDLVSFIDSLSMSVIVELHILVHTYSVTLKYQKFIIEKNISSKQNIG